MRRILLSVLCFAMATMVNAVPAKKVWKTMSQSDGTTIKLMLVGDEFMHYYLTSDGLPVINDGDRYVYAKVSSGNIISSGVLAHEKEQRSADESLSITTINDFNSSLQKTRLAAMKRMPRKVGEANGNYIGSKKGLIILVSFSDYDFAETDPKASFYDLANKKGYNENGSVGSVHDYFYDQSYGNFDLTFDVAGPYKAPKSIKYYGQNTTYSNDAYARELIKFAMNSADADVNYKDYDWDNNGEVDQVYVVYAGYAESSGAPSYTIWPHESQLGWYDFLTLDGVRLNTYACGSELEGDGSSETKSMSGIGVMCHEFSHCLGLPDFYDVTANSGSTTSQYGMDMWDIMSSGPYNGDGKIPAAYTGYERHFCGWLNYRPLEVACMVSKMKPLTNGGEVYQIVNPGNSNEYYLLENRNANYGWDRGFYTDRNGNKIGGLLIYHVTYDAGRWKDNTANTTGYGYQCMTIFHADNSDKTTYVSNGNTYLDGNEYKDDLFPYAKTISERVNSFSDTTTPQDVLNTANSDGSYLMHTDISAITKQGSLINFRFFDGTTDWSSTSNGIKDINVSNNNFIIGKAASIYTVNGVLVKKTNAFDGNENLTPGLYIVKSGSITQKIIIN